MNTLDLAVKHALPIIIGNEGNYGSVHKDDNGALSIGKVQWHGSRALALMKTLCSKHPALAKATLGTTLYNEITNAASSAWNARVVSAAEASLLKAMLLTAEGKAAQDALAEVDVTRYVQLGIKYGLTDVGALILFADGINQFGEGSPLWKTIAEKAIGKTPYKGKATGDAKSMLDAAMDTLGERWIQRRQKVYEKVLALGLGGDGSPSSVVMLRPAITYGMKGEDVRLVQKALTAEGFSVGVSGADGSFGPDTLAAVKAFQAAHGLAVDGSVGPVTQKALGLKG